MFQKIWSTTINSQFNETGNYLPGGLDSFLSSLFLPPLFFFLPYMMKSSLQTVVFLSLDYL